MHNSNIVYIICKIRPVCTFLQAVRESVQASTDDSVLKCLIDLADTCPKLLRANLEPILDLMLEVQSVVVKYFILGSIG